MQMQENRNGTKYKIEQKCKNSKIQTRQNTTEQNKVAKIQNVTKNKCNKIQMEQNTNAKMPKYKHEKIQKNKIPIARIHL